MSAQKRPIRWQRAAVLAAIAWFVVMFVIAGAVSTHSLAAWIGRMGSITVIAGVVLNHRAFATITGHAREGQDDGVPPLTRILIVTGIVAIIVGFVLGIAGF